MLAHICIVSVCGALGPWWTQADMKDQFFGSDLFSLDAKPDYPFRQRGSDPFEMASLYLTVDSQAMLFRARLSRERVDLTADERTLDAALVAARAAKIVDAMVKMDDTLPFVSLQAMLRADVSLEWNL